MGKKVLQLLTLVIALMIIAGCNTSEEVTVYEKSIQEDISILLESISIDTNGILRQIERSRMPNYGYRSANASWVKACPFATFFINHAKIHVGLIEDIDALAMAHTFLERLEDEFFFKFSRYILHNKVS